jgi:sugar-specific transcriptional regulator TrmB
VEQLLAVWEEGALLVAVEVEQPLLLVVALLLQQVMEELENTQVELGQLGRELQQSSAEVVVAVATLDQEKTARVLLQTLLETLKVETVVLVEVEEEAAPLIAFKTRVLEVLDVFCYTGNKENL